MNSQLRCKGHTTPLWSHNPDSLSLCNACSLFFKLHGIMHPLTLRSDDEFDALPKIKTKIIVNGHHASLNNFDDSCNPSCTRQKVQLFYFKQAKVDRPPWTLFL